MNVFSDLYNDIGWYNTTANNDISDWTMKYEKKEKGYIDERRSWKVEGNFKAVIEIYDV